MRILITLAIQQPTLLPYEQNEALQAATYSFLDKADHDFARMLHDTGYVRDGDPKRHFKLFTFSNLRIPKSRRQTIPQGILVQPGVVEWIVSSPLTPFLERYATGLLDAKELRLHNLHLPVREVQLLPVPDFARLVDPATGLATARFTCLTPIVASIPSEDGHSTPKYLRPLEDGARFATQVHQNLLKKHALVNGDASSLKPDFRLEFDREYLQRDKNHGTKKIRFKSTDQIGAMCPLTITADPALLRIAWECGLGEKNSSGFGMLDFIGGVR